MSDFDSLDLPCLPGMGCPCREAERDAIVAWLRAKAERAFLGERDPQDSLVGDFATWIERGEHLAGDDV